MKTSIFYSLSFIFLSAAVFQTVNAQTPPGNVPVDAIDYSSIANGNWISLGSGTSTVFTAPTDAKYKGARWSSNPATDPAFPGASYPGMAKQDNNWVTINAHNITLDTPADGNLNRSGFSIYSLNVDAALGTLDVNSATLSSTYVTNQGKITLNSSSTLKDVYWLQNYGTLDVNQSNLSCNTGQQTGFLYNYAGGKVSIKNSNGSNSNNIAIYDFENDGSLLLDHSTASMYFYTGKGTSSISFVDQSVLSTAQFRLMETNKTISVTGKGNVIDPINSTGNIAVMGTLLNIEGSDMKTDQLDINMPIYFQNQANQYINGEVHVKNAVLNYSGTTNVSVGSLAFVGDANSRIGGTGLSSANFKFNSGSYFNPAGTASGESTGTFAANTIGFNNGSTVYIDIGNSGNYDHVIANSIQFNGNVNVVLINLGNTTDTINANAVFNTVTGPIYLDGKSITTAGRVLSKENNVATITNGSSSITAYSAQTQIDKKDTVKINNILIGADGKTLGFNVTGVDAPGESDPRGNGGVNPPTPPKPPTPDPSAPIISKNIPIINQHLTPALSTAIGAVAGTDRDKIIAVLNQLDPVMATATVVRTQNDIMVFKRTIERRIQLQHDNEPFEDFASYRGQAPQSSYKIPVKIPVYQSRWKPTTREIWAEVLGDFTNQKDREGIRGYSADTGGFGAGIDKRIHDNWVLGAGFSGMFSKLTGNASSAKGSVDSYIFSLYGSYTYGDWLMSLTGGYAYSSVKTTRYADLLNNIGNYETVWATGDTDSNSEFLSFNLSYRFGSENQYITPFFGFDYAGVQQKGYTERGVLINMNFNTHRSDAYLQTFGVRFGNAFQYKCWLLTPEFTVGWIHDYGRGDVHNGAQFIGGTPFVLTGAARNNDRALIGLGVDVKTSTRFKLFARYDGELAKNYGNNTVQIGFGFNY